MTSPFPLLESINFPAELREVPEPLLPQLAQELRAFLIDSLSRTGGHFSSNLGVVELAIALHYVFNTPEDRLVWDVGHQSYPHKILTGRRTQMHTLRQLHGISGFPKRTESIYDSFGVGHSSTSISAALGMAIAAHRQHAPRNVVAIIGDGAMTAGMAFEALNHAGGEGANLLVILNDNDMSISPNVGALSNYLAKILSSKFYSSVREGGKQVLSHIPYPMRELVKRTEEHVKGMLIQGSLFEELGFNYIGPVDGHDLHSLIMTLRNMKDLSGPQFLHLVTKKGKGYAVAEREPCIYHGVTAFNKFTGEMEKKPVATLTYTQIFGQWLCDMAAQDAQLVAITPAMCEGSGMVEFVQRYPQRFFDVGIAEQHSVTLAAGLVCEGLKPVVAIYSTFMQRAYDQLIHDVALQQLPVLFAIDRAGLVGADGPTHAGAFDLAFLRCIPHLLIMTPADEHECYQMLTTGFYYRDGPSAVRYPRGYGVGAPIPKYFVTLPIGQAEIRREGQKLAFLVFGTLLHEVLHVAEQLDATVINMRFVKPLDTETILNAAGQHALLVTVEEGCIMGGAGSAVNEILHANGKNVSVLNLGLPDKFVEHGSQAALLAQCGLDRLGILQAVQQRLAQLAHTSNPELYQT
jgi:1-deoxy-D-xylulose-5-phosphate synthase